MKKSLYLFLTLLFLKAYASGPLFYGPDHNEHMALAKSYAADEKLTFFPPLIGNQVVEFLKEKNLPTNDAKKNEAVTIAIEKNAHIDRPHALATTRSQLNLITVSPDLYKHLLNYLAIYRCTPEKKAELVQHEPKLGKLIDELESEASGKNHMHPWIQHKLLHEYGHWYFNHYDELYPYYKQQKEKNDRQLKAGIVASGITLPALCHSILTKHRSLLPLSLLTTASLLFTAQTIVKKKVYVSRIPVDMNINKLKKKCYEFEADHFAFSNMTTPALKIMLAYSPTKEEFPHEYDDGIHPLAWQQRAMIERIIQQREA